MSRSWCRRCVHQRFACRLCERELIAYENGLAPEPAWVGLGEDAVTLTFDPEENKIYKAAIAKPPDLKQSRIWLLLTG